MCIRDRRFTDRCFLSCPANTYRTEIKTVKGIRIISVIKLKVQNPTKNSIATAIATFSRISFEKKRPPSAFSIALVKRGSCLLYTSSLYNLGVQTKCKNQPLKLNCLGLSSADNFKMIEFLRIADRTGGQKCSADKSPLAAALHNYHILSQRQIFFNLPIPVNQLGGLKNPHCVFMPADPCLLYTSRCV